MQPFYTKAMNYQIAKEIGTAWMYTLDDPRPPPVPHVVMKYATAKKILMDQRCFRVPWSKPLNETHPTHRYNSYMLGGDEPGNTIQRNLVGNIIYGPTDFKALLFDCIYRKATQLLNSDSFNLSRTTQQIDFVRDVAIPCNSHMLSDLFSLDLKTPENPNGSLHTAEMYGRILDFRTWGFYQNHPAVAWNQRRKAGEAAEVLAKSTKSVVDRIAASKAHRGLFSRILKAVGLSNPTGGYKPEEGSLRWYGSGIVEELLAAGQTVDQVQEILWLTAVGGVGGPVTTYSEVMVYFLDPARTSVWDEVQKLAAKDTPEADRIIRRYVVEAQRLTNSQKDLRVVAKTETVDGVTYRQGDIIALALGEASRDKDQFPDPLEFKAERDPAESIVYGWGPHQCLGKEISTIFVTALVKLSATLKNLRTAPGEMGMLRKVQIGFDRYYLTDDWSNLTFDPTSKFRPPLYLTTSDN